MTTGKVTTASQDDVEVDFDGVRMFFDDQIEVTGDNGPFSAAGDFGALVIDELGNPFGPS